MALIPQHNQKPIVQQNAGSWSLSQQSPLIPIRGYAQVADFIATDKELAVYRRFDRPAARCLLRLQSRIQYLQDRLDMIDRSEATNQDEKRHLAAATILEEFPMPHSPMDDEKQNLMDDLTADLKTYYDLLAAQSAILKMETPAGRVKKVFNQFLTDERCLVGLGDKVYPQGQADLVALRPAKGEDRLSQFLRDRCTELFKKERGPTRRPYREVFYGPEGRIAKTVGFISIFMAAVLLVGAIISLYFLTNPHIRLGLLAFWTVTFSLSVSLLSTAKRSEVFASTAAYCAVLVVFVSGDLANVATKS